MERRKSQVVLSLCGMLAPAFFLVMVVVAGMRDPGYSHLTQAISELGAVNAPDPATQDANFFVTSLLITAFTLALHRGIGRGQGSALGPGLPGGFGVDR